MIKRLIKNWSALLLIVLTILMTLGTASADVIFEPNDGFYSDHRDKCEYTGGRSYTADGEDGTVTVWKSPVSKKKIAVFDNGSSLFINYSYIDKQKVTWGVVEFDGSTAKLEENIDSEDKSAKKDGFTVVQREGFYSGWVRMDELKLIYDNIAFLADHESELKVYNGEFDGYVVKESKPVLLWSYPGSGKVIREIESIVAMPEFSSVYTDADDRQWGYIAYYEGSEGWICFTDPTDNKLPVVNYTIGNNTSDTKQVDAEAVNQQSAEAADSGFNFTVLLLGVLVLALVIFTAVIIRVFYGRNKSDNKKL